MLTHTKDIGLIIYINYILFLGISSIISISLVVVDLFIIFF
jgi:hypothetical protein